MITTTPADKHFSNCIRARANWHCENCGGDFSNYREYLDCSHFITRGEKSVRVHPLNAFAHCKGCHQKLGGGRWGGGNVAEFTAHYDARRGPWFRLFITKLARMPFRYYDSYIPEISKHYREQFKRIDKLRKDGNTAYQHFPMFGGSKELNAIMKDIRDELKEKYNSDGTLKVSKNTGVIQGFEAF